METDCLILFSHIVMENLLDNKEVTVIAGEVWG